MNENMMVIWYLIGINSIAFILMGVDKEKAKKHAWRIPEKTLWITAIIGGAVGSYLGMKLFRHKTKHTSFRVGIPLLIIFHLVIYGYISFVS